MGNDNTVCCQRFDRLEGEMQTMKINIRQELKSPSKPIHEEEVILEDVDELTKEEETEHREPIEKAIEFEPKPVISTYSIMKIPSKLKDLGSFTILIEIGDQYCSKALCDLGAMHPEGVIEDTLVKNPKTMHSNLSDREPMEDRHTYLRGRELKNNLFATQRKIPLQEQCFKSMDALKNETHDLIQYHPWDKFCTIPTKPMCLPIVHKFYAAFNEADTNRPMEECGYIEACSNVNRRTMWNYYSRT
ncbi:hypothetical protein EPI10_000466 [Gossypium australe]|uniref:Uncharacterized protein n=1 Tax=Gossypium australe TaxID=47621 RepID=A0A5B6V7Y6_9ROSI|nr:hypothetical protein EPI10_000466 [Gossypium australe]